MMGAIVKLPRAWQALAVVAVCLAGFAAGLAYFGSIRWQARAMIRARRVRPWVLGAPLLRAALVAAGLFLAARGGATWLLAAALGLWLGRARVLRAVRGARK